MSTSYFEAWRQIALGIFVAGWEDRCPIAFENRKFDQPETGLWGRFSIREADRMEKSIGANDHRNVGMVYLQLFAPEGAGTKAIREAADLCATIFDGTQVARSWCDGHFRAASIRTIGLPSGGKKGGMAWYQINVSIPFQYDTLATEYVAPDDDFSLEEVTIEELSLTLT